MIKQKCMADGEARLSAYLACTKVWLLLLALKELCVDVHICNPSTLEGKEEMGI